MVMPSKWRKALRWSLVIQAAKQLQDQEENLMAEQKAEGIYVPIEWYVPEDLVSRYANNIVVQYEEHEFIISFFEVRPPVLLGSSEEIKAKLEQVKSVRAECVARIIVAADRMPVFIEALQGNLEKYLAQKSE
jgi:hypothetical protein